MPSLEYDNRYPSPSSSNNSRSSSKCREDMFFPDENPFKKGKINHPKERTTEHLNLHNYEGFDDEDDNNLQRLLYALRKKRKIVVIAGAGISVSAGSELGPSTNVITRCGRHDLAREPLSLTALNSR